MPAKGEFEVHYIGEGQLCGGLDFSRPYSALDPNSLAPGTVNTQSINGFLCSAPWVAGPPFSTGFLHGPNEYVLGYFQATLTNGGGNPVSYIIVVTNNAVYESLPPSQAGGVIVPPVLNQVQTLIAGTDTNLTYMCPGNAVSFLEINGIIYFSGLMFNGIYALVGGFPFTYKQATPYVCAAYLAELDGRMIAAECRFPTGGGPLGNVVQPAVAWSGVGIYGQAYDGNPAHDVWNPADSAFFNGNIGGYNLLSDVPDYITGIATEGRSALITRTAGITQMDPNSTFATSGVQPFTFYHLWASPTGIGALPNTVAQFGQLAIFLSDDNVYSISLSGGLQPIGNKIIGKILADQRNASNLSTLSFFPTPQSAGYWYFASIVNIAGQLHYLLAFSAWILNQVGGAGVQQIAYVYDYNVSENSWHFWDTHQAGGPNGGLSVQLFSCPIVQIKMISFFTLVGPPNTQLTIAPRFLLVGSFAMESQTAFLPEGFMIQFVPFDYDAISNPINPYIAALYPVQSILITNIVFRGEVISAGHKITNRRLRLQVNNAPSPNLVALAGQQAVVTFTGISTSQVSPVIPMQGNAAYTGAPIQTCYGDCKLSDEIIQASLAPTLFSTGLITNQPSAMFRLASVSMVGNDTTGTTA